MLKQILANMGCAVNVTITIKLLCNFIVISFNFLNLPKVIHQQLGLNLKYVFYASVFFHLQLSQKRFPPFPINSCHWWQYFEVAIAMWCAILRLTPLLHESSKCVVTAYFNCKPWCCLAV